ncbi:hypothetical protein N0V90_013500 [Kalmusia sp. IMI 367209]|nr:hypothetical protein N0V90_013500 [Kalmusia sp. IMI 367209]
MLGGNTQLQSHEIRLLHSLGVAHTSPSLNHFSESCSIQASLSHAFEYFLHHSSPDLKGVPYIQTWQSYILRIALRSTAIQHAVAALSELHEWYSYPTCHKIYRDQEGWRQYYLSAKQVSALITTVQTDTDDRADAEEEILIACAIFITIEVLFGNIRTAIRHLKSGISLVQDFMAKRHPHSSFQFSHKGPTSQMDLLDLSNTSLCSFLDGNLPDLIGLLALLDLQMMTFFPPDQAKYEDTVPSVLYEAQFNLIAHLIAWHNNLDSIDNTEVASETANLLLTYHLTTLKVHAALSSEECLYKGEACVNSFRALIRYTIIILQGRKPERPATRQLSLETSTVEAMYFLVTKCRDATLRRRALSLLQCAGREGVWDGLAMAVVAEHVLRLEEGRSVQTAICSPSVFVTRTNVDIGTSIHRDGDKASERSRCMLEVENLGQVRLINEVNFSVDRNERTVNVKCGWFDEKRRVWDYDTKVLTW